MKKEDLVIYKYPPPELEYGELRSAHVGLGFLIPGKYSSDTIPEKFQDGNTLTEFVHGFINIPLERVLDETSSLTRFIQEETIRSLMRSGEEEELGLMDSQIEERAALAGIDLSYEYVEAEAQIYQKVFKRWMRNRSKLDGAVVKLVFDKALPEQAAQRLKKIQEEIRKEMENQAE